MTKEQPLVVLRSESESAAVVGSQWGEFKTMGIVEAQDQLVCGVHSGQIWRVVNHPHHAAHEMFVNANAELFEQFLVARDEYNGMRSEAAYLRMRSQFLSAEPSLALRTVHSATWREFLDECAMEFER